MLGTLIGRPLIRRAGLCCAGLLFALPSMAEPDAMYLKAPIDATAYYKVVAKVANPAEWKTSARGASMSGFN